MAREHHVDDLEAGGIGQVRHEAEEIVIVGGGIGGLAFACALHR
jgi:NADPH-dependent 2,4-dienoyl-CoA reductase/sulfur reductase-like enzyme